MVFSKSFTQQPDLPEQSIQAANRVLASANLHRYQSGADDLGEVAEIEQEFAAWQNAPYCLAVTSGGQAMQIALRASGVKPNDPVLTNSFTLAPVPGAIRAVGANPVLVETTKDLVIDLDDLTQEARATGARVLLLSHMRGHIVDMDELGKLAQRLSLLVIEDCAHTMGATWRVKKSGYFGKAACFSTQTYKHLNSGEGGFLTSDDPNFMARAIILSGSYMNYERHGAAPAKAHFDHAKYELPNMSARMDALRAAILRPQLEQIAEAITGWNVRCKIIETGLSQSTHVELPHATKNAQRVGSSVQFRLPHLTDSACETFLDASAAKGVA